MVYDAMPLTQFRLGEPFRPAPQYRSYLYAYLVVILALFVLPWLVPIILLSPAVVAAVTAVPILAIIVFVVYWVPLYHRSITYQLTLTEITWQRGVWFRQTGIVPYNRITNVDIVQGPLMRVFSFSALRVQTAGYSGQARAEIVLNGIEDPKALQEMIMGFVRRTGPVAVGGEPEQPPVAADAVVEELRAIRRLLEIQVKK
jgi:membrane protein YdbS with pleckstrin-like domain